MYNTWYVCTVDAFLHCATVRMFFFMCRYHDWMARLSGCCIQVWSDHSSLNWLDPSYIMFTVVENKITMYSTVIIIIHFAVAVLPHSNTIYQATLMLTLLPWRLHTNQAACTDPVKRVCAHACAHSRLATRNWPHPNWLGGRRKRDEGWGREEGGEKEGGRKVNGEWVKE